MTKVVDTQEFGPSVGRADEETQAVVHVRDREDNGFVFVGGAVDGASEFGSGRRGG